jgi:Kef-type K+ transport system membrane component KefB
MPDLGILFLQMLTILAAAKIAGLLFRLIHQPEVLGEMLAGILLGPSLLGKLAPQVMTSLFAPASLGPLYALSQIGLILFMFLVGVEVHPGILRQSAKSAFLASVASIVAPFVCGGLVAEALYSRLGAGVPRLPFVLFLGSAMGVTAFPVLARILAVRKLWNTRIGVLALSCAAVNDVAAWCLLAVITVVARPDATHVPLALRFGGLALYVLAMVGIVRPALRRLLPEHAPLTTDRFSAVVIVLLISVWSTEFVEVHALFGAFLAGVVMPKDDHLCSAMRHRIESVTLTLLLPLFFAYTGLRTSVALVDTMELWLLCGVIIAVAVGSKLLVTGVCIRVSGIPWRESLAVGALVNARGLVELVILNVGLDLHILSATLFSMMVIMAIVTTFITTPLLDWTLSKK